MEKDYIQALQKEEEDAQNAPLPDGDDDEEFKWEDWIWRGKDQFFDCLSLD